MYNNDVKECTAQEIWDYDNKKTIDCKLKGIELIHIKEYDWLNDKESIKQQINKTISEKVNKLC